MTEYIDRERLVKKFCGHCYFDVGEKDCAEDCFDVKIIKSIPVADVQSVAHGRWIGDCCSNCGISKYNFISFNVVGEKEYARPFGTWNYCPRCGAKMDREA